MSARTWLLALALTVAGCATMGGYQPTVDPHNDPHASRIPSDQAECRELALQASGGTVKQTAIGGGAVGCSARRPGRRSVPRPGRRAPAPAIGAASGGLGGGAYKKKAQLVCAPAAATPVSSTTTTTVPSGPCDFNSDEGRCEGTCGNGGRCSAVVSGGACECRTTPCGDAPECEGFCAPNEACIFTLTDCSCVSIP